MRFWAFQYLISAMNAYTPNDLAVNLRAFMESAGLNPSTLARKAKVGRTWVDDVLNGRSASPRVDRIQRVAVALGTNVSTLIGEALGRKIRFGSRNPNILDIPEMNIHAGAGGQAEVFDEQQTSRWAVPVQWIRSLVPASHFGALRIITVIGDSMEPTLAPTDRILVDTQDCRPSPPGIFVIWDGVGLVVKRVELRFVGEHPRLRLISDNAHYPAEELSAEEVAIRGRVLGKWKWM
jgi:transcriptional regulator with XRE-family HTH domain